MHGGGSPCGEHPERLLCAGAVVAARCLCRLPLHLSQHPQGAGQKYPRLRRRLPRHRCHALRVKDFTTCLVLRMRSVPAIDSTAMNALFNLTKVCENKGITLVFSHVNKQPLNVMKKSGFVDLVGRENFCPNISAALKHAEKLIQ